MKRFLFYASIVFILFLCIPLTISSITKPQETMQQEEDSVWIPPQKITVHLSNLNQTIESDLETCVKAWLSATISENTPFEAIKAHAVAARSYLLDCIYRNQQTPLQRHDAMLCDDNGHCVSLCFKHQESTLLQQALSETQGEYLCYNNLPARCFFFSVSAGKTESALDVWSIDLPYLISVESLDDARSAKYQSKVTYPLEAFKLILKSANHDLNPNTAPLLGKVLKTETGHVKYMDFYGERFTGEKLQQLFHLNSTNFTVNLENNKVTFDVKGSGHGVGMSLFGAQEMAKKGENYCAILMHYYQGTTL